MEKPLYPSKYMRITQSYGVGSHYDSYAIDEAGIDQGISTLVAPFTGIIKKIYTTDANEVWLESTEPVAYPDGTIDYMTIMLAHSNDASNLFVGQRINRGEAFYSEGTKGQATGNHCHIECGKGRFYGTGWYKNQNGNYSINNNKKPEECLWIDDSITILDNQGITFKKITEIPPTEEQPDEEKPPEPIQPVEEPPTLIYTCKTKGLYGIYLSPNDKVYLKKETKN